MELLVASAVAARRVTAAADYLFEGVDLRLFAGSRVGLVGANGSGKSTLLRLLASQAAPDEGAVVRAPGVRTALLDQDAGRGLVDEHGTVWQVAARALVEVERIESRLREVEVELSAADPGSSATAAAVHDALSAEHVRHGGYGAAAQVREILAALGFPPGRHTEVVSELSDGERQRLGLAAVLASPVDVLLLDEP
ncbi:MAG TPA: ATP-binding cassette domain-containing protein, partial [Trueperaceae bacterium]|nr:ATP-binding cassette domain-containing protein [Trueperaceae bacterium]